MTPKLRTIILACVASAVFLYLALGSLGEALSSAAFWDTDAPYPVAPGSQELQEAGYHGPAGAKFIGGWEQRKCGAAVEEEFIYDFPREKLPAILRELHMKRLSGAHSADIKTKLSTAELHKRFGAWQVASVRRFAAGTTFNETWNSRIDYEKDRASLVFDLDDPRRVRMYVRSVSDYPPQAFDGPCW